MYYTFDINFDTLKSLKISELCPMCRLKDTCKYKCNKQLVYEGWYLTEAFKHKE